MSYISYYDGSDVQSQIPALQEALGNIDISSSASASDPYKNAIGNAYDEYTSKDPYFGLSNSNNYKAEGNSARMQAELDYAKMLHQEEWSKYELDRQMEALKRNGVNPYYMFTNSAAASGSAPSGGVSTGNSASGKSSLPTLIAAGVAIAKIVATVAAAAA